MGRDSDAQVRPGDGSELRPVSGLQWLWRGQFETEHEGHRYAVDVDYFDPAERSVLYRDGRQLAVGDNPARFDLDQAGAARIETDMGTYGMKRVHLVTPQGSTQLRPAPGTGEAWRADLARERPGLSRALAVLSALVLMLSLGIEIPQLLELMAGADWWAAITDWRPTAPVTLSPPANTALSVAGVAAGLERALSLRHHWLLDD